MAGLNKTVIRLGLAALCSVFATISLAAEDDIEREFNVAPGGLLTVESDAGSITVDTWDEERVRVRIRNASAFDVEMSQSGNDVNVRADGERGFFRINRSNISFMVDVPFNYNVDLDTGGGAIDVADINGDVVADTSGGSITVGRVTQGDVKVDTSGGRIRIGDVDGDVVADTSGGRIEIGNVSGDVEADTSGGSIDIGNVQGDLSADTSGGNITVGLTFSRVSLDTSGGTIRADWAEGEITADTSGGNIILAGSNTEVNADTSGGNIEIARSNGPVYADTSGGRIRIRQATGPIRADTSGGSIDAELANMPPGGDASVVLETSGGDITMRIPANHPATIQAELHLSRRAFSNNRIYTDFPLSIQEGDDIIIGRGDINGGGDRITLETTNSDITIIRVED